MSRLSGLSLMSWSGRSPFHILLALVVAVLGIGCDSGKSCPPGSEKCACYGNQTCNTGLSCFSGLCVSTGSTAMDATTDFDDGGGAAAPIDASIASPPEVGGGVASDSGIAVDSHAITTVDGMTTGSPDSGSAESGRTDGGAVDVPQVAIPPCGDGVKSFSEQCDDSNANSGDGCSATCRLEIGFKCDQPGTACTRTTCGDGKKEGAEGCDDSNSMPFDGCSQDCQIEPKCSAGHGCSSQCGDGLVLGEDCDDGNSMDGDGCSSACKVEPGWICAQPEIGEKMMVPAIYRDFRSQNPTDFEGAVVGNYDPTPGMVSASLNDQGRPVLSVPAPAKAHVASPATFAQWYTNVDGVNHATASKMALWNDGAGNYVNRYGVNGEQWNTTTIANFCGTTTDPKLDTNGKAIPCTFSLQYDPNTNPTGAKTDCQKMEELGYTQLPGSCNGESGIYKAYYIVSKADGNPLFFPVDGDTFTPSSELKAAVIPPYYDATATWPYDVDASGQKRLHNFSYTSEIRSWFRYDGTKPTTLDFVGDDDLWVFIDGKLAADLGGIHILVHGILVIGTNGNATATVTATYPLGPAPLPSTQSFNLGLKDGTVYEIAIFQAERQSNGSSLKVSLPAFNTSPSLCTPCVADNCKPTSTQPNPDAHP